MHDAYRRVDAAVARRVLVLSMMGGRPLGAVVLQTKKETKRKETVSYTLTRSVSEI